MSSSIHQYGLLMAAADGSRICGGKDSDLARSFNNERSRALTTIKKISLSARRALQLVSRSIEHRGPLRSGSASDVSCDAQTPGDSSLCSHIAALPEHLPDNNNSFCVHQLADLPSPKVSTVPTPESLRRVEDPGRQPPLSIQPQQSQFQKSSAPPVSSTVKPRSLLSALLKRQSSSTSIIADAGTTAPANSASLQKPPTPPGPPACSSLCHVPNPGHSPGPRAPQACAMGWLYDSLPAQQDRRNPLPSPMLVLQHPSRHHAAERIDVSLSAPNPHVASLKRVLKGLEHSTEATAAAAAATPLLPPSALQPVVAACASSVRVANRAAAPLQVQAADSINLPGTQASPPVEGYRRVPLLNPSAEEAALREPSPVMPATSLLALSLGGVGRGDISSVVQRLSPGASLQKRLYKGKMSSVYKGRCLQSGLPVALKVYFKDRVPANVIHMVMREVSIHLQATEQRNVLKLYGVFQNDDVIVLVLELAARGSLSGICKSINGGRLSEAQVRQTVVEPLLDALSYLHGKGVCHRDIKAGCNGPRPENLLITADWGLRLADFGVSINLTEERAVTRAGTGDYMAPEVERCPLKAHPEENKEDTSLAYTTAAEPSLQGRFSGLCRVAPCRAVAQHGRGPKTGVTVLLQDVWSVGVLVYELLVGFPPILLGKGGLKFPASVSPGARDFIISALAHLPEERPTVRQLRCHPWMLAAGAAADQGQRRDIEL
ncbi:hypothetical protein VOLCADRAFT_103603 [Volvox carteri f. nagariensis]|uniref:Protein kinase domain-containing protein n=1 Tax=Volvox carteri f. nagariensis TaxID=3068 RepID=D8TN32_VOLCA|nr:uncharacterized protein VOLCADRAFT_103603 [Volvox carteri f. nagariensis]EFJ51233.1 hypothetical protein VOLCADRAFT_103603 [Volvox carteri f. nagariensis]|eukprot:XP_002947700.1 hypothetical protein VOLCADRAFT_103603 [Volvox carteri f. nagariensis]